MALGFTQSHYVISCEGKYYNHRLQKFVHQITASCLIDLKEQALKISDTLEFVHEIKIVECFYFSGMTCRVTGYINLKE